METPPIQTLPPTPILPLLPPKKVPTGGLLLVFVLSALVLLGLQIGAPLGSVPPAHQAAAAETQGPFSSLSLEAKSAYVLDMKTHEVLYSLNPEVQLPLASLTKVSLALVISDVFRSEATVKIPQTIDLGPKAHLVRGDFWRVRDILDVTLAASSNNGAQLLTDLGEESVQARYPQAPSHAAVLWRMNDLARELGLTHTYFLNTTGLDVSTTQSGAYGSAHDMATLFAYAASSHPDAFSSTTQDEVSYTSSTGKKISATNTDQALEAIPGIIMGKTGLTDLAGGNLAVVFDVGPAHPVVAVVLGSSENGRFDDVKKLVAAAQVSITR